MSYMLITVCEREIGTEQFETFSEAHSAMMNELAEEFFGSGVWSDYLTGEEAEKDECDSIYVWNKITKEPVRMQGDADGFEYGNDWAWSNLFDSYKMDWKIVSVKNDCDHCDNADNSEKEYVAAYRQTVSTLLRVTAKSKEEAERKMIEAVVDRGDVELSMFDWVPDDDEIVFVDNPCKYEVMAAIEVK